MSFVQCDMLVEATVSIVCMVHVLLYCTCAVYIVWEHVALWCVTFVSMYCLF